ncbi:MAG: AraC family transcriptional regulator ligand-binding domain-containing protein [Geminicoccaceae bacterium]
MPEPCVRVPVGGPPASSLDILARLATARLDATGVDWRPIAATHGLALGDEPRPEMRIPTRREHAFLEEAAEASRDPLFLWRLGDLSITSFGLPGYAILHGATVAEALETLASMMPSVCEAVYLRTVVDGASATLVYANSDVRQNSVFVLHCTLNLLRDLIGPQFAPTRVGLAITDRCHLPVVARQISAPVSADLPYAFITFPARHLRGRVLGADERLAETLRPYWEPGLAAMSRRPAIVRSRLEGAVVQTLHEGVPTLERLADNLLMRRGRLASEMAAVGGYRAVVEDVRRRLAQELIQRTDLSMAMIAESLGFSEAGALTQAYRRWTGHSPASERLAPSVPGRAPGGGPRQGD